MQSSLSTEQQIKQQPTGDSGAVLADGHSEDVAVDSMNGKQFLTFSVANAEYGVDIMQVREIKVWSELTRLPNSPEYMRGVLNLRGVVIPIFDLRARFGQGLTADNDQNVVIILAVNSGQRIIGILVDAVSDIVTIADGQIKPAPPKVESCIESEFVTGLFALDNNNMVVLLNVDVLFATTDTDIGNIGLGEFSSDNAES